MKRTALFCAIAALPFTALAEESTLASIVITGRTAQDPGSTSVPANQIRAQQAATSDTASLLRDIPGVSLYGAGGASSLPAIHGLADDRLRIKVDGMDLIAACPNHMNPALSYLDPSNVAKLTVFAGITPVSAGGDSIGGTILAETPAPRFAAPEQGTLATGEIGGFYRSNGDATGGNVAATLANENFSISYAGSVAKADNYTAGDDFKSFTATGRAGHTLDLDEVGSSAYDTTNQTLGLAWRNGAHLVEAKFGWQDVGEQLFPNQRMDMLENDQERVSLRYQGKLDWGTLEARAYRETVDHFMDFGDDKQFLYGMGMACSPVITAACATGMPMNTETTTTGGALSASIDLSEKDLLRLGGEVQRFQLDDWWPPSGTGMMAPNKFININDGTRDRNALFAEWESRLTPQWLSVLGVRYDQVKTDTGPVHGYNQAIFPPPAPMMMDMGRQGRDASAFNTADRSQTDNNWDWTALARYTPSELFSAEIGLARKVRSPNLYERYSWSTADMMAIMNNFNGDGNGYIGDINLKPEKAHTLSTTFDWHAADRSWEVKATPYYTDVSDYIDAIQWNAATNQARTGLQTDRFTVLKYANQDARLFGLDLSGHVPLDKNDWGQWGVKGLLSYTKGENRETDDGLYNIMPLNAKLILTHQIGAWDNALEVVGVSAKDDLSEVRNEIETAGYGLMNLRVSHSWKTARVDLGVDNLFDRGYALPLGGAYTGQGTTMGINSIPWGIAVPGIGRSMYAGFNLKF